MTKSETHRMAKMFVMLMVMLAVVTAGCTPLKKKFTRQKKKDQLQDVMPVLEPMDYPAKMDTPEGRYAQHYGLWAVWHKELTEQLSGDVDNEKHVRYIFSEDLRQLEKMGALLVGADQEALQPILSEMKSAFKNFSEPAPMRNMTVIQRKLRSCERSMRERLSLKNKLQLVSPENLPAE